MGAIFCQTRMIIIFTILIISITWGTQNWNGGMPSLSARGIFIISIKFIILLVDVFINDMEIPMNIIIEAIA